MWTLYDYTQFWGFCVISVFFKTSVGGFKNDIFSLAEGLFVGSLLIISKF
jgi:hypothetical protein